MDLFFLILLNGILLIRPAEFIPGLVVVPLYEITLACCLLTGGHRLLAWFSSFRPTEQPITTFVFAFWGVTIGSNLIRGNFLGAWESGFEFFKVVLYFMLVVAILTTDLRFERFLAWTAVWGVLITGLAILNFTGKIQLSGLAVTEEEGGVRRMGATGLFADPNDMCFLINQTIILLLYFGFERTKSGVMRGLCGAGLLVAGLGLSLTHSRGGFLGLLAGLAAYLFVRFGKRAVPIGLSILPALLLVFGGRQTDLLSATSSGSGQTRIHLWDSFFGMFSTNPLTGVGAGQCLQYCAQVAHNSFLHAFAELGFFGGSIFLGFFFAAGLVLVAVNRHSDWVTEYEEVLEEEDPEFVGTARSLLRFRPYLMAWVVSAVLGLLSLSRMFAIPTYSVLAVVVAYESLLRAQVPEYSHIRLDGKLLRRCFALSVCFLIVIWVYIRRNASYYS
jgi:O-antigen ligase